MQAIAHYYKMLSLIKDPELTREAVSEMSRAQFFRYKKEFDERYLCDEGN